MNLYPPSPSIASSCVSSQKPFMFFSSLFFPFLCKNNFISSAHASPYARSLWEISLMKYHSSPLSTIYYCIVARTIDKSINTLCSFANIWKGGMHVFSLF